MSRWHFTQLGFLPRVGALLALALAGVVATAGAQPRLRARDLGVPFVGTPGPLNAITDIKGVEVGFTTLMSGRGPLKVGVGPVRTGVTAILPRGQKSSAPVFGGWFSLNGNGEMTGTTWLEESGVLDGPVMITNTHSVGVVRDAVIAYQLKHRQRTSTNGTDDFFWSLPIVAETYDGFMSDINGFHVKPQHVFQAIDGAHGGAVAEGNVGSGTGMICYGYKGGIGTSSRQLAPESGGYTVGVLAQCNCGSTPQLQVAGVPVGVELAERPARAKEGTKEGSIIIIIATDAPLLPHQLKRLARRAALGLARTGSVASNGSGDLFLAFSTANLQPGNSATPVQVTMLPNDLMTDLFAATTWATEEAIINTLVAAQTITGLNDEVISALPHDQLQKVLKRYNRLRP